MWDYVIVWALTNICWTFIHNRAIKNKDKQIKQFSENTTALSVKFNESLELAQRVNTHSRAVIQQMQALEQERDALRIMLRNMPAMADTVDVDSPINPPEPPRPVRLPSTSSPRKISL